MTKPLIQIGDEVREMTETEYKQHLIDVENSRIQLEQIESKAEAKTALLNRLGLTDEEAKLLLA